MDKKHNKSYDPQQTKQLHSKLNYKQSQDKRNNKLYRQKIKPKVFIPIFPGTNCEFESEYAFIDAGANVKTSVFLNQSANDISISISKFKKEIITSQIIFIPGGFSAGDEPNGSGKFIAAVFFNLREEIEKFLNKGGLILGICNGFQALIKLGLVPFGTIIKPTENQPTLTFNDVRVHQSGLIKTKIIDNSSPWLSGCKKNEIHTIPISHGEGKFIIPKNFNKNKINIATKYLSNEYNPNGSMQNIEGITALNGRIFGKMAHSERSPKYGYKNISEKENWDQKLFESGVKYFQ
jgi:phosphoribosylformylglycinamidine synthase